MFVANESKLPPGVTVGGFAGAFARPLPMTTAEIDDGYEQQRPTLNADTRGRGKRRARSDRRLVRCVPAGAKRIATPRLRRRSDAPVE